MNAAVFQATYSDWKLIRTRKVVQIVLEIPVERSDIAYNVLGGMPRSGEEDWLVVARLNMEGGGAHSELHQIARPEHKTTPVSAPESLARAPRPFTSLPLPQQAALLCQDPVFRAFLIEDLDEDCPDEKTAADKLRYICGVASRSELKPNTPEGKMFIHKREQFMAWKLVAA